MSVPDTSATPGTAFSDGPSSSGTELEMMLNELRSLTIRSPPWSPMPPAKFCCTPWVSPVSAT